MIVPAVLLMQLGWNCAVSKIDKDDNSSSSSSRDLHN